MKFVLLRYVKAYFYSADFKQYSNVRLLGSQQICSEASANFFAKQIFFLCVASNTQAPQAIGSRHQILSASKISSAVYSLQRLFCQFSASDLFCQFQNFLLRNVSLPKLSGSNLQFQKISRCNLCVQNTWIALGYFFGG